MKFTATLPASMLFVLLLSSSVVRAQGDGTPTPYQRGIHALQFQISDNFTLDSFSGTIFSYKRQLSDYRAKRIGLSLNNLYNWKNYPDNNTDQNDSRLDLNAGINYTWMRYMNPGADIKFYYGYGPGINLGFERSVQEEASTRTTAQQALYGIAGIGYAGVEWFFQSSMSLHAEYRASARLNHQRLKTTAELNGNEQSNKTHNTSVSLGGDGIRFGLSVYF